MRINIICNFYILKKVALFSLTSGLKKSLNTILNESEINRIGRLSGFVSRKSKLTAFNFLVSLMFSRFDGSKLSLNDISNELYDKFECNIKKQSINERFNERAVKFMKMTIAKALEEKIKVENNIDFLDNFTAVKVQDSTSFQLPKHLANHYGGCGGNASGALARIQFEYDLKSSHITTLEVTSGKNQDIKFSQDNVDKLEKGELIIRDLGYVSGKFLNGVIKKEAFYLNRLRSKQIVYTKTSNEEFLPLNFASLLKKMNNENSTAKDIEIFLKIDEEYVEMRMIAEVMPDEIYEQRIRKAAKEAKKKKRNLSDEYKLRCRFNLFITNVDQRVLKTREVNYMYSLRWQIELIFKSWKSTFSIDQVKKMKKERFECQLFAKLLLIIVSWNSYTMINNFVTTSLDKKATMFISYYKFCKIINLRLESFMLATIAKKQRLHKFITSLVCTATKKQQYIEPKSRTLSSIHILEMINQTSDFKSIPLTHMA